MNHMKTEGVNDNARKQIMYVQPIEHIAPRRMCTRRRFIPEYGIPPSMPTVLRNWLTIATTGRTIVKFRCSNLCPALSLIEVKSQCSNAKCVHLYNDAATNMIIESDRSLFLALIFLMSKV